MGTKLSNSNAGTGIAIGLPFFILGIAQENLTFFIIGIALAVSLGASSAGFSIKNKKKS